MEFNLLPYREARRMRQRAHFFRLVALSCAVGLLSAFVMAFVFDSMNVRQRERNALSKIEINKLDQKIQQVVTLQAEIAGIKQRQKAVELLQSQRYLPVRLMNALTAQLPDGIRLIKVLQSAEGILISGEAISSDAVFEWMRQLSHKSNFFSNPELMEMRLGNSDVGSSLKPPVFRFGLRVKLQITETEPLAPVKE